MRLLYSLAIYLIVPLILLHLAWRGLRVPAYLKRWGERFGRFPKPPASGGVLVHAVSVGEVNAATPLIRGLLNRFPAWPVTVTTFTPTGSARVRNLYGDSLFHVYAPLDTPGAVRRCLDRLQPKLLIIMETEIWPNLYHQARARGIPVVIANARLSERSVRGYRWFKRMTRSVLHDVSGIAAQTRSDADRLVGVGARPESIEVVGSLKFDIRLADSLLDEGEALRRAWGSQRPVLLGASTHEGDETALLASFTELRKTHPDTLLILVPRHPERFARCAQLARQAGLKTRLRSEMPACQPDDECFVIDSMGELLRYCAAADIAIVGGSYEAIGGHNVLEPAALGKPVVVGPHMANFQQIIEQMLQRGAALQVDAGQPLTDTLTRLLNDPQARDDMGQAGLKMVREGQGAVERTLDMIDRLV